MIPGQYKCSSCKDTGMITLLTSSVPCNDCHKPSKIDPEKFIEYYNQTVLKHRVYFTPGYYFMEFHALRERQAGAAGELTGRGK